MRGGGGPGRSGGVCTGTGGGWERGEPAVLDRDRLWGNRDRAETGRDGWAPGRGWGDRTGSGAERSPGDWREWSATHPGRAAAVGTGLGGARRGDRDGIRDRDTGLGGVCMEGDVGLGTVMVGG